MQIFEYDFFGFVACVGNVANNLILAGIFGAVAKGNDFFVALLHLHFRKINTAFLRSCGGSRLKAAQRQIEFIKRAR